MTEQRKLSRPEKRRLKRLTGWAGAKSFRKRDGVKRQIDIALFLFGRWADGKKMEDIKSGYDDFFETIKDEFQPEMFKEIKRRLGLMIEVREDQDKEEALVTPQAVKVAKAAK